MFVLDKLFWGEVGNVEVIDSDGCREIWLTALCCLIGVGRVSCGTIRVLSWFVVENKTILLQT
jgi:hypothetical protein